MPLEEFKYEFNLGKAFQEFDRKLSKELIPDIEYYYEPDLFGTTDSRTQTLDLYEFNGGITIARERCDVRGTRPHFSSRFPDNIFKNYFWFSSSTFYYIFHDSKPILDETEIKKIIQRVTGIKLPKLRSRMENKDFEVVTNKVDKDEIIYDVATEILSVYHSEEQPDGRDIAEQTRDILGILNPLLNHPSVKKEFGLSNKKTPKMLEGLRNDAKEIYDQFKKELEPWERKSSSKELYK